MRPLAGFIFLLLVLLSSASAMEPGPVGNVQFDLYMSEDKYVSTIKEHLTFRSKAISFFSELKGYDSIDYYNGDEFSDFGKDIVKRLQTGLFEYEQIREKGLEVIEEHRWSIQKDAELIIDNSSLTGVVRGVDSLGDEYTTITINILDEAGPQLAKQIKIGLAAALILYDNFLIAMDPLGVEDSELLMSRVDRSVLSKMAINANNLENIEGVKKAILYYKLIKEAEEKAGIDNSMVNGIDLDNIIENSIFFEDGGLAYTSTVELLEITLNQDLLQDLSSYL